jgi:hypothetical protein
VVQVDAADSREGERETHGKDYQNAHEVTS